MSQLKISRFLALSILGMCLFACSTMHDTVQQPDATVSALSLEQRDELLEMLKSHKDNEELIQQWRQNQPGLTRLLAIESELRVLIEQLNELSSDNSFAREKTVQPIDSSEQPIISQPTQTAIPSSVSNTQKLEDVQPVYQVTLDDNNKLAGMLGIQLSAMKNLGGIAKLWEQYVKLHASLLGDLSAATEVVESSNGTIYRLKAGPFDNDVSAQMRCTKLRQVNVTCIVVKYTEGAKYLPIN
jgi:hypothetical protein